MGRRTASPEEVEPLFCGRREIAYIDHLAFSNPRWDPTGLERLARTPLILIRVPQRERDRAIDVGIVDPRTSREAIPDGTGPDAT